MTTSGVSDFNLDLADAVEEAYERAGTRLTGGYMYRTARRSIDLMMVEWANKGLNLWLLEERHFTLVAGTATYTLEDDTIDVIECDYRTNTASTNQTDLTINRISVSDWSDIPNKLSTGSRPLQYFINRLQPAPVMHVWPVPDGSQSGTVNYWCLRRVENAGTPASNTMDMPFRFLSAFVAGLAYHLALKIPSLMERVPMLKQIYDEAFDLAAGEDRDRAPVRLVPWSATSVYGQ